MAVIGVRFEIKQDRIVQAMREAAKTLDDAGGELFLDFASVRRLDPSGLRAMEEFADIAYRRGVKVVLCDVNIEAYKVLKLVKLAKRFSFLN